MLTFLYQAAPSREEMGGEPLIKDQFSYSAEVDLGMGRAGSEAATRKSTSCNWWTSIQADLCDPVWGLQTHRAHFSSCFTPWSLFFRFVVEIKEKRWLSDALNVVLDESEPRLLENLEVHYWYFPLQQRCRGSLLICLMWQNCSTLLLT